MEIRDKVIVVTGGASGIGKALAIRFVAEGAKQVVIADLNEEAIKSVAQEIGCVGMRVDVANETDVIALVQETESNYGQIDLLCNNAGIGVGGGPETPNEDWQRIWEINVMAHVYATRALPG